MKNLVEICLDMFLDHPNNAQDVYGSLPGILSKTDGSKKGDKDEVLLSC